MEISKAPAKTKQKKGCMGRGTSTDKEEGFVVAINQISPASEDDSCCWLDILSLVGVIASATFLQYRG